MTIPVKRRGGPGNEHPVHEDTPGVAAEDEVLHQRVSYH